MKYIKICLIIVMLTCTGKVYACYLGDVNSNGFFNVQDIVLMANCILGSYCDDYCSLVWIDNPPYDGFYIPCCLTDMDGNEHTDVLDIIHLA